MLARGRGLALAGSTLALPPLMIVLIKRLDCKR